MKGKLGRQCSHCGRDYSQDDIARMRQTRSIAYQKTLAEMRAAGRHIGRPPTIHTPEVLELRRQGLSLREIAASLDCSKSTVQNVLRRNKGQS